MNLKWKEEMTENEMETFNFMKEKSQSYFYSFSNALVID